MPYCPKCKQEYESGNKTCSDCDTALVASLPAVEKPDYDQEAFLVSAADGIRAEIIVSFLQSNHIPARKKHRESGAYMEVLMGMTSYGIDIYVPSRLLDEAKKLLKEIDSNEEDSVQEDSDLKNKSKKYNKKRVVAAWIILVILLSGILTMLAYGVSILTDIR